MPSKWETERQVGAIIRRVSGQIKAEFETEVLEKLYKDESFRVWSDNIGSYFHDRVKKKRYNNLLIVMELFGINPDESKLWEILMKMEMPIQFYDMMDEYTQVPGLSARNRERLKKDDEEEWFKTG